VSVRYYLQRDLYIFGGLLGLIIVVGIGGLLYRRRQIERLRKQRTEMGLDVDTDDDDPPR
jgi:nitrate reductase gamma subunit